MNRPLPSEDVAAEIAEVAAIVGRARKGDQVALRELYERYYRTIYNLVYRMIGRREEALDLTSEAFIKAFRGLKKLKTNEAFGGWLKRVATNLCLDYIKRKRPSTVSLDAMASPEEEGRIGVELPNSSRGPDQLIVAKELGGQVQEALEKLSPIHRAVILLHHVDGREVKEIAEIMDCSEGTVKSRLGRARENLRKLLSEYVKS